MELTNLKGSRGAGLIVLKLKYCTVTDSVERRTLAHGSAEGDILRSMANSAATVYIPGILVRTSHWSDTISLETLDSDQLHG